MSTKTTFKRIALVAVAALGLGVISVAPSSASVTGLVVTVANGTAGLPGAAADSTTAATVNLAALMEAGDSVTVEYVLKSYPTGAATPAAQVRFQNLDSATPNISSAYRVDTGTITQAGTVLALQGFTYTGLDGVRISTTGTRNVNQKFGLQFDSVTATTRIAGTYTYTILVKSYSYAAAGPVVSTSAQDVSLVIAAVAAASETPSAAYSGAFLAGSTTASPNADSATVNGVATAGTTAANLNVRIRNVSDSSTAVDTTTITLTGPGLISGGAITSATKYYKGVGITGDTNYTIIGDGTAGVATIKVEYGVTGQSFTKTVTFYAANATTITTSQRTPSLRVGTNDGAVGVTAVDATGNPWTGQAYIVASSAADALIAGSATPVACATWSAANGIRCNVAGTTAGTAKFKVIDASTVAAAKATSAEFSLTVSAAPVATVKVEFDKATYGPYEKAIITVSALDASGALMPANTFANLLAAGGITSNQAFTGTSDTLTAVSITTANASSSTTGAIALKAFYTVYMPAQGDVVLTWTGGTTLPTAGQVKATATASVVNSSVDAATDAANEATDAANAATDAALAAADAADAATAAAQDASDAVAALSATVAKLVASLKAQITSLTNLVIKIQLKGAN